MTTATIDHKIRQILLNIRNLPTPPIVFHQIQKALANPECSAQRVAGILAEDPGMSVKVLRLTNSAFYGLAREIDSVKMAVIIVGQEAVKNLVLSASVLDMFKEEPVDSTYQDTFWRHSLATACCCRLLSGRITVGNKPDADSGFSAGLLHDIGKMVIACYLCNQHQVLQAERAKNESVPEYQLEDRVLGFDHGQIGGYLASLWKLPERLVEAISYHHRPELCPGDNFLPHLVNVSDYVARQTFSTPAERSLLTGPSRDAVESLGTTDEDLAELGEDLVAEYSRAETFLEIVGSDR